MTNSIKAAAVLFAQYAQELAKNYPASKIEADELASQVVDCRTASADEIWSVLWNKPLFANRHTDTGKEMARQAAPHMLGVWRSENRFGPFSISRVSAQRRSNPTGKTTEDFRNTGVTIDKFKDDYGIAYQFSYAIICAGRYLRKLAAEGPAPMAFLHGQKLEIIVPQLEKDLGFNWGHVAVLHFLTDLGLACKPDIHVVRCMDALGLFACSSDNPTHEESYAVNRIAKELLPYAYSGSTSPRDLRHLDKMLMEISRQKILPQGVYEKWPDPPPESERRPKKARIRKASPS